MRLALDKQQLSYLRYELSREDSNTPQQTSIGESKKPIEDATVHHRVLLVEDSQAQARLIEAMFGADCASI